ncbi:hypothetical protein [Rhizosphaericola mali]|uniref:Uncharacterized protein n=1 Tax=Rhizosphaericola mali TaxID=2545455 RepID=A0A5P2FZ78_9BACT|nr:hypothetical protein [Rhizosphaericola mali]QES88854.1 hypothetical protein E0W69_009370 [Rhizosphaericola mali]
MADNKPFIPITIATAINELLKKHNDVLFAKYNKTLLIEIRSNINDSFYFIISSSNIKGNSFVIDVEYYPSNGLKSESLKSEINFNSLSSIVNTWVLLIKEYKKVEYLYNEDIANFYAGEYYEKFELDPNDETLNNPLNFEQQDVIYNFYLDVENNLDTAIEKSKLNANNRDKIEQLEALKSNLETLKDNITSTTKRETIKNLSIFLGKCRKASFPLVKEIFKKFIIDVASKTVLHLIGY